MQKFRDYIYCDENKLNSYIYQIEQLKKQEISGSYEKETHVDGGINAGVAKVGTTINETTLSNYKLNISNLEQLVDWSSNPNNAINYDNQELDEKEAKENLIVLKGKITIPEVSANIEAINSLASNTELFEMIPVSNDDKQKMSLIKVSDNIPILLELDSKYIFNFNLKKEHLKIPKDDFYDNIDEEITVIGRIEKIYNDEENIEIYDLAKEVFKLNRAVRRSIPKDDLKDSAIYEMGPLVKITPIIMYK